LVSKKKIRLRKLFFIKVKNLFNIFFYCTIALSIGCTSSMQKVQTKIDKSLLDSENADSVTLYYSTNGQTRARLAAKKFTHVLTAKPPYVDMTDGIKVQFFGADDSASSVLTARRGRYFEDNNNVLVRDSVVITNNKNEELHTEELVWNEAKQIFYTEKKVTIYTPTQIIIGQGMEANQDFTYYKIINPIGIIAVPKNKLPN
jgi:LPS export ABC transporter protein LptC